MIPRISIPDGWATLWAHDGAVRPPRTFVVLLDLGLGAAAPLGTVVAPTAAAARVMALSRWPGARRGHLVRAASRAQAGPLLVALAYDAER